MILAWTFMRVQIVGGKDCIVRCGFGFGWENGWMVSPRSDRRTSHAVRAICVEELRDAVNDGKSIEKTDTTVAGLPSAGQPLAGNPGHAPDTRIDFYQSPFLGQRHCHCRLLRVLHASRSQSHFSLRQAFVQPCRRSRMPSVVATSVG